MHHVTLNVHVFAKQKINLTWLNISLMLLTHSGVADLNLAKEIYCTRLAQWSSSLLRVVVI